ncbi:hypothetical protein GCM10010282_53950 [Streptomyces roseolus]|nr:hypothetical protein GCM10010282_53950 [Streptomyces roseolus]
MRAPCLGRLDGDGAETAGTRVDEHLLTRPHTCPLDQRLHAVRAAREGGVASGIVRAAGLRARSSWWTA